MKDFTHRWLTAAAWAYFTILFGWVVLYLLTGDRFGYLSLVNMLAVYLFLPLPVILIVAIFIRRWEVWIGTIVGIAVFLWFWGDLFLPNLLPDPGNGSSNQETFTVMTYNVLGKHDFTGPLIETIQVEDADIVLIQELNPTLASALQTQLTDEYPYQIFDPKEGVTGIGTISKYPIEPTGDAMPIEWVGVPQIFTLDWQGKTATVVNFHMVPGILAPSSVVSYINLFRESEAQALSDFAYQAGPVIAGGDANVTHLSDAYQIVTSSLEDSWRTAGFGFGHTFPGSAIPGSSRPRIFGRPVPRWLVRIDYVFHSSHWTTVEARLAKVDGVSDHRGVVAVLLWNGDD